MKAPRTSRELYAPWRRREKLMTWAPLESKPLACHRVATRAYMTLARKLSMAFWHDVGDSSCGVCPALISRRMKTKRSNAHAASTAAAYLNAPGLEPRIEASSQAPFLAAVNGALSWHSGGSCVSAIISSLRNYLKAVAHLAAAANRIRKSASICVVISTYRSMKPPKSRNSRKLLIDKW